MSLLNVNGAMEYLENNYFTNIKLINESDNTITFKAYDTEEELEAIIEFELMEKNEEIFVNIIHSNEERYLLYERLSVHD